MRIEFLVENIENFLPTLSKILPIHSQIPVLSNILLEATSEGFFINATNLEIGIRIKIPAKVEEEGAITVPGKQFIEVLSSLPKDKITIFQEKDSLILNSRENKVAFQTISKEEFPTLYEQKGEKIHDFAKTELEKIFTKLIFSTSTDESRPELTGILLLQKDDGIDFVATDGFRLSIERIKGKKILTDEGSLILPGRLISEVLGIKSSGQIAMYIYKKSNQVIFETGDVVIVGRLINGEFPNYERVIPTSNKTKIILDREEFVQKLRTASVFARESANIIRLRVEDGKIKIFSKSSGLGEGEVSLEGEQEGSDNEIAFNVKFITDILKNLTSKSVELSLSSSVDPAVFKTEEDSGFIHIIMPVRVQE